MTLTYTHEKFVNGSNQVMTIIVKCKSPDDFGYDDVKIYISHHGKTMEVSDVLAKSGALEFLVDDIDWHELAIREGEIMEEEI